MKGSTKTYSGVITVAVLLAFVVGVYSQSSGLPQDGLVNYWKLDGDAKDSAGNLDGDVRGATPVNGLFGQAYKFDEDIDYIFLGNHTAEEDRYTVSLWFKTDSLSWQTLFHRGHTSTCFYNPKIDIQNGRVIVSESDCSTKGRIGGRYYPGIPFKLGEWNHAVITVDGNIAKFYLNGYLQVIDTSQSSPPENLEKGDERVVIGATRTGRPDYFVNSFNGLIDDVAVWNRALPDSDVETIYKQVYPNAKPPAKLDVEYQQVETFPTNKPKFDDKYTGDSSWTVETGQWFVENNILKNANDSAIITLDSVATPGKSIRTKLRQPSGGSKQRYSLIYVGYQDKNNTYYVSLDTLYKTIYIRRAVNGIEDSIGLAVDVFYDKWYDVEVRWLSSTEIQVEIWDENGKSLGVLTRDNMFDSTTSKDWATGKFGFGGIRYPGRIWFDDVRLGTIKNVVQPSPSPTPSPTGSPSPTTSPTPTTTPSPTPSSSSTATPSPTPSMSPSTTPSPTVTPSPSVSTSPKDFELTMTTNTDIIKEGEDVWLTVVGAPSGEEDTTIYLFNFDTAKNGLPTVSNFELVGKSNGGKGSTTKTFTNAGVYTVAVLGVGGLASDNPSNRTARTEHIITVKDVPPKANAGNDITVQQGQKVPFNGGGSYAGDYDETFFYWDVDASDGLSFDPDKEKANLTGQAPQFPPNSYSYSKPGVYTVTLRVFDDDGTFSDDTLQTNVLELTQPTSSPSPTPSPTPTPPPEVSQLKLPLKSNNLDAITRITSLETDFLLSVVGSVYGDLDKQDKKFLTDLPSEIASKGIQKDALVEDVLADVFIKAFEKETDENTQVDIVEAIGLIQSQKTIGFISNILNYKIIGNCASE
ncbi:MAG TPA: LamG-like jellyroll fold domain-containing protein, partial [archaeon]|nr:LamG-like jellyroll fold domain-containing protein [archaeon]